MLSIIVAIAENNAIGKQGDLLCHMSADLRRFKAITTGHTVVMGRATWESLPKRPLPGRRNIVISTRKDYVAEGAEVVNSIEEAQACIGADEEAFVIGGGQIYRQMLSVADKLYITHIHHTFADADTFFPEINPAIWATESTERYEPDEKNPYPYSFVNYVRK